MTDIVHLPLRFGAARRARAIAELQALVAIDFDNLAAARAQTAAAMDAWVGRVRGAVVAPEAVDAQTREKLAALGYIGASPGAAGVVNVYIGEKWPSPPTWYW